MNVVDAILLALVTFAILALCKIRKPETLECPLGFTVEQLSPDGRFECVRLPRLDGDLDPPPAPAFGARIHCTGGSEPIVRDHRTTGCMRRFR